MRNGWVKSWTTAARILVPPVRAVDPNVARRQATRTGSKVLLLALDEDGDVTRMVVTWAHDHPELVLELDIVRLGSPRTSLARPGAAVMPNNTRIRLDTPWARDGRAEFARMSPCLR